MEWIGLVALALILCYASYPGRVKRLEATVKNRKATKGRKCHVLDADDEWIKVSFTDKKKNQITKLLRIENISEVEIIEIGV